MLLGWVLGRDGVCVVRWLFGTRLMDCCVIGFCLCYGWSWGLLSLGLGLFATGAWWWVLMCWIILVWSFVVSSLVIVWNAGCVGVMGCRVVVSRTVTRPSCCIFAISVIAICSSSGMVAWVSMLCSFVWFGDGRALNISFKYCKLERLRVASGGFMVLFLCARRVCDG